MRTSNLFAGLAVVLTAVAAFAARPSSFSGLFGRTLEQAPPESRPSTAPPQTLPAGKVLEVKTRVVTVDVVATDSRGVRVRDLRPEDFEISDDGPQKITHFRWINHTQAERPSSAAEPLPKGSYSNQQVFSDMTVSPTVVLIDALNTEAADLMAARGRLLRLLKALPPGEPVAVVLLRQSLTVVQSFTNDPALLRDAVDETLSPSIKLGGNPENDPHSASRVAQKDGQEQAIVRLLQDLERTDAQNKTDVRVDWTLSALTTIARYLSGYPGRKTLIWVSGSFPIRLMPNPSFGSKETVFQANFSYGIPLEEATNALSNAQVAVYPVDARGVEVEQGFFDQGPGNSLKPQVTPLNGEDDEHAMSQVTMDEVAQDTGGKTCKNTNNLSGCVEAALEDSSSYYELAYVPDRTKWDGRFHRISVKTSRPGVKLAYRRGYFARDTENLIAEEPNERLKRACRDPLPSTGIPISAQEIPPTKPDQMRYMISFGPSSVTILPEAQSHTLHTAMGICVYTEDGSRFGFLPRDITQTLGDVDYAKFQSKGFSTYLDVKKSGTGHVRVEALDLNSGLTGALDIPAHPENFNYVAASPPKPAAKPALHWDPPPVDVPVPSLALSPACSLPDVLKMAAQRAEELVDNLRSFDAHEQIRYERTNSLGEQEMSINARFDYLVDFGIKTGAFNVEETRTPLAGTDAHLSAIVSDNGLPGLALVFSAPLQTDYQMRCEGLTEWNAQPAWVVYFRQRNEKPPRTAVIPTATAVHPVSLKGRAWIAADSGYVIHLETNLVKAIALIDVQAAAPVVIRANSVSVNYAPVKFESKNVVLWLPESAVSFTDYGNDRMIVQHTFSDFRLFSVQTRQVIGKPTVP
ncbi:MAG TPA: VWA domain-containing protein [Candidatus Cybelea sp.]|nr:VWA domain-containing protein [Candidatus Cybelea sp.]